MTDKTPQKHQMDPPNYEEIASDGKGYAGHGKFHHHIDVRDEVEVSRAQHVMEVSSRLMSHVRERARRGLSRSNLLILPSDQGAWVSAVLGWKLMMMSSRGMQTRRTGRIPAGRAAGCHST
jgi:hypothetical protein